MRTLLSLILSWLLPSTGKRRATAEGVHSTHPITADSSTRRLIISTAGVELPNPPAYLRGEDTPLIRPYLIAHEKEQERRRQKERRRAAVLATLGQDYPSGAMA